MKKKKIFKRVVRAKPREEFFDWFQRSLSIKNDQSFLDVMSIPIFNFFPPIILSVCFFPCLIYWLFKRKKEIYYEEV